MLGDKQKHVINALRKTKCFSAGYAALEMKIHTNTVYFHIGKIKAQTGHDPQTYDGMRALLEMMEGGDA